MVAEGASMTMSQKVDFFRPWGVIEEDRVEDEDRCSNRPEEDDRCSNRPEDDDRCSRPGDDDRYTPPEDDDRASVGSTSQQGFESECSSIGRLSDFVQRSPDLSEEFIMSGYGQQTCDAFMFGQPMLSPPLPLVHPYPQTLPMDLVSQYGYAVRQVTIEEQRHRAMKKYRPKKFQCPSCMVAFSNNGQLKGHMRIHTGERPFECTEEGCGKKFTRNEELTRHKRIHTGVKPFTCAMCNKSFGRKDHLKKHHKTHEPRNFYQLAAAVAGAHPAFPLYPMHDALTVGFNYGL